jgi:hypothetical protein
MKQSLVFALGLTCLISLFSKAQAQAQQPSRQYYVGLGGVVGSYQLTATHTNSVLAPQLLGGVRLSPRLALEASLAVYHSRTENSGSGIYQQVDSANNFTYLPATFRSVYQQRTQAVALQARYALLRQPAAKLQLDALLGVAVVHSDTYGFNATIDQNTQATVRNQYYVRYDATGGCLLLGPSLRYRPAPHLELASEFVANFAAGGQQRVGRNRLSGTLGLSARYLFGGLPQLAAR